MTKVMPHGDYEIFKQICSLTTPSLLKTMKQYLKKNYKEVVDTKDYVYAVGDIPVVLCAHCDTVFSQPPVDIYYDPREGVIWSPQGGCGDDRAGVFAIIKILQQGFRPSIIFSNDEEIGSIGACKLVKDKPDLFKNVKYIIQLDRRGKCDSVYYSCDNKDFESYINNFGFITAIGSFTDITTYGPAWGVACVNLSVGYKNEHSISEILHINALYSTISKVINMLDDVNNAEFFKYIPNVKSFKYEYGLDYLFSGGNSEYYTCDNCHKIYNDYELFQVENLDGTYLSYCPECINTPNIEWCENCCSPFIKKNINDKCCSLCKTNKIKAKKITIGRKKE